MNILQKLRKVPMLIPAFQAGSLMGAGDGIAQFLIEKKKFKEYDWHRTARFFGIGFVIMGPTLRVWYNLLDKSFGSASKISVMKKVSADQLLFAPSFIVIFLSILGMTENKSLMEIQTHIKNNYFDILTTNWIIWPAAQVVNFSFVPLQHQVLVVQFVALIWNTYLSWKTNK